VPCHKSMDFNVPAVRACETAATGGAGTSSAVSDTTADPDAGAARSAGGLVSVDKGTDDLLKAAWLLLRLEQADIAASVQAASQSTKLAGDLVKLLPVVTDVGATETARRIDAACQGLRVTGATKAEGRLVQADERFQKLRASCLDGMTSWKWKGKEALARSRPSKVARDSSVEARQLLAWLATFTRQPADAVRAQFAAAGGSHRSRP